MILIFTCVLVSSALNVFVLEFCETELNEIESKVLLYQRFVYFFVLVIGTIFLNLSLVVDKTLFSR